VAAVQISKKGKSTERRRVDKTGFCTHSLRIGLFAHGSNQVWSLIMFCEFISRKVTLRFFMPEVPYGYFENEVFFKIIENYIHM